MQSSILPKQLMLLVPSTRGCFLVQELGGTPFELVLSLVSKGDGWKCRLRFASLLKVTLLPPTPGGQCVGSFGMELLLHPTEGESTRRDPHFFSCACFSQPTLPAACTPAGVRQEERRNLWGILCSRKARGLSGL